MKIIVLKKVSNTYLKGRNFGGFVKNPPKSAKISSTAKIP